jgi:hypothetical protein
MEQCDEHEALDYHYRGFPPILCLRSLHSTNLRSREHERRQGRRHPPVRSYVSRMCLRVTRTDAYQPIHTGNLAYSLVRGRHPHDSNTLGGERLDPAAEERSTGIGLITILKEEGCPAYKMQDSRDDTDEP